MNIILSVLTLFALTSSAVGAASQNLSCKNIELVQQDDSGKTSFSPTGISVSIEKSSDGKFGYKALISSGNQTVVEKDVKIETALGNQATQVKELASVMLPTMKWEEVHSVRVGNVGVSANLQDAGGLYIFELVSAKGTVLGKLATVGWGFGRCGK